MKSTKEARIIYYRNEEKWILRLWNEENSYWAFLKSWEIKKGDDDPITGDTMDYVNDDVLREIAHMQNLGYKVQVIV